MKKVKKMAFGGFNPFSKGPAMPAPRPAAPPPRSVAPPPRPAAKPAGMPANYVDDLAGVYKAASQGAKQIFGPQPMPSSGLRPMPAPTTASGVNPTPLPKNTSAFMKKGGMVKSSASKRGDGIAQRGKTKGKMV